MATEYLAYCRCTKKVVAWSQGIIRQLDETHRCLFPAILTYRLSCDVRVVTLVRERALGNSATQLYTKLHLTKKLAGAAAKTDAVVTNVGNEYGQVLISDFTCADGEGLLPMAVGLIERYRLARVPSTQLMYVNRDCCSSGSKTAALFSD
ncbi:hypothetical protein DPEC_G00102130 [Dallia pectoralis]|uniref:Uncharacterized protein n=1 Tax=Dallia pectoralis TaxID=75939 RepID=A0ACC2GWW1_DALPE|nr:hypothetical protein DPEC_G00102130 [Dallia pectoralis]